MWLLLDNDYAAAGTINWHIVFILRGGAIKSYRR
jgi:hypothetical protein